MSQPGMNIAARAAAAIFMIGGVCAQTTAPSERDPAQSLAELSKQVSELRIEVTMLRLAWQQQRIQTLEEEIRAVGRDRRIAESDDAAAREGIAAAETGLAGAELQNDERVELTNIKNVLVTEDQQRLGRLRTEIAEREAELRREWEREMATAEACRRTLQSLQDGSAPVSPAKPAQ